MVLLDLKEAPRAFLPAVDVPPSQRRTRHVSSVCDAIATAHGSGTPGPVPHEHTLTEYEVFRRERIRRREARAAETRQRTETWNPARDPLISGDPRHTLIVARLPYATTPEQLRALITPHAAVGHVRVVANRGYAFVVLDSVEACWQVLHATGGVLPVGAHQALIDRCRSYQPQFKPRKLGGTLGGRFSLQREKLELTRKQNLLGTKPKPRRAAPPSKFSRQDTRLEQKLTPPPPPPAGRSLRRY